MIPEPYRRLAHREGGPPRCVPRSSLPEIEGSLFAQQFGWIVRAADGPVAAAFLGRAPAPGRRSLTAAALVVPGSPRLPGLRVRATRSFEEPWFGGAADDSGTPALLAGRYVADGPAPLPEELVVELLDPQLPPLIVECLPDGLLVATAGIHLRTSDLEALAATTERLTGCCWTMSRPSRAVTDPSQGRPAIGGRQRRDPALLRGFAGHTPATDGCHEPGGPVLRSARSPEELGGYEQARRRHRITGVTPPGRGADASGLSAGITIVAAILLGTGLGLGLGLLTSLPYVFALAGAAAGIVLGFYVVYLKWIKLPPR